MTAEPAVVSNNLRLFAGAAVIAAAALYVWATRSSPQLTERAPTPITESEDRIHANTRPAAGPAQLELASDGIPIMPAGSAPTPSPEPRHPHPITAQHERIYRENNLTFALDGAVDVEDAPGIRRLLARYRDEFPEDSLVLQQGYAIIADCLEHPSSATRAAAQRFYDTELASALRRHVRRHCLER